ncbi:MAG: glycosyltransferase family 2 protein [Acidimicrobiaceae bacterium]|nr:glycosyltransferase family 2 protein [Acidimicrobiia bacterium]MCY4495185.1 glycosyltransferase family 2 protein [Acidimicrobiaceae bacterium]
MSGSERERTIVVVPAYNEQEALPAVLAQLAATVGDLDVIVVDDGSSDSTATVARDAGVRCIVLPFNLGIGGALRAGYRYAVDHGYQRAVQFDADGQHRADQIGVLTAALDSGADLAVGSRFLEGDYDVGRSRAAAMWVLRVGVRVITGQSFSDTSSGFRAIQGDLLEVFAREYPVNYMDSVETLVEACRRGYTVVEVPALMSQRTGGVPSQRPLRLVYHYARLIVALIGSPRRRTKPTRAPR